MLLLRHYALCEVCNALATRAVRDIAEVDSDDPVYRKFQPFGNFRFTCDDCYSPPERISLLSMFPRRLTMPQDDVDPDEEIEDEDDWIDEEDDSDLEDDFDDDEDEE